jgi:hypothetical protein
LSKIGRSEGKSAIACAAYRSCSKLYDPEQNKTYNFLPKRKQLVSSGIVLPEQRRAELARSNQELRQELWIKAHEADRRKNSVLAREIIVALPKELEKEEVKELTEKFAGLLADRYRVAVDFAIHSPPKSQNIHAHLMFTTREIEIVDQSLVLGKKTRILDDKKTGSLEIERIRENWEKLCNQYLLNLNLSISRKSQRQRGKKANPHLKRESYQMAKRGIFTPSAERLLNKTASVSTEENSAITSLLEEEPESPKKTKKKKLDLDYGG